MHIRGGPSRSGIGAGRLSGPANCVGRTTNAAPDAPSEYSEPLVTAGCPAPPAALTDSTIDAARRVRAVARHVDAFSEHRVFVYFMAPEVYTASFGGEPFTRAWSEIRCTGDACQYGEGSVYAPQTIAPETLQRALMENLGIIRPPTPVPCDPEGGPGLPTCDIILD